MGPRALYTEISAKVNAVVPGACALISVREPVAAGSELRFTQLVIWAYVMCYEAARVPTLFLAELAGDSDAREFWRLVGRLRTFLAHNLDSTSYSDRKTLEYVKRWFRGSIGQDFPASDGDFGLCAGTLESDLRRVMEGALRAADLLRDPIDGPGLVADLAARINLEWPAAKFDDVASRVAERLGVTFYDTRALRQQRLDAWRDIVRRARPGSEIDALERVIEGELIAVTRGMLSVSAANVMASLELRTPEGVMAALLLIRDAEVTGGLNCSELLEVIGGRGKNPS